MTLREICFECGINRPLAYKRGKERGQWVMTVTKVIADNDFFIVKADTPEGVTIFKEDQYQPLDNFTLFKPRFS